MTRQQAARRLRKMYGSRACYRVGDPSSPEQRAAALAAAREARAERERIESEIQERLQALDWYQELRAKQRAAGARLREAQAEAGRYAFQIGHANGIAFLVEGSGDTWEEAFAAAERHRSSSRV